MLAAFDFGAGDGEVGDVGGAAVVFCACGTVARVTGAAGVDGGSGLRLAAPSA